MEAKIIIEVIKRLTGAVNPVGASEVDSVRLKNLKTLTEVTEELIRTVSDVHDRNKHGHEASVKAASDHAKEFLQEIGYLKTDES